LGIQVKDNVKGEWRVEKHKCDGFGWSLEFRCVVGAAACERKGADWTKEIQVNAFKENAPTCWVIRGDMKLIGAGAISVDMERSE
jgi:hypothetical protein